MTTNRDLTDQSDITKMKPSTDGTFKRAPMVFRSFIEKGGKFDAAKDRYHLYVSYACPWATRALIVRKIKGLEDIIPVTVVSPRMGAQGWPFASADEYPGAEVDPNHNSQYIKDLYMRADPNFTGRFTVPVLWDKTLNTIVNNESSEIIRMFNTAFNDLITPEQAAVDFYPPELRSEIDSLNEWIYPDINNGVYRSGFATSQPAYEEAVQQLFKSLDKVEKILTGKKFIVGDRLTECDIRLWVTMIRFDPVYVGHFKCNIRTIRNGYPAINAWMKDLYWNNDAFKSSTDFNHIKVHYYWSHQSINGHRIVPLGPVPDIEPL